MRVSVALNRKKRNFLILALASAGAFPLYRYLPACKEIDTLSLLQNDLFPDIDSTLTTTTINARGYISYILHHPRVSKEDKRFIKNGLKWLNEEAHTLFELDYSELTKNRRQKVLEDIAKTEWGESFIETILTYIFEALLGDPIYGINKNEAGWKWLHHTPGLPRPTTAYPL